MLIELQPKTTFEQKEHLANRLRSMGFQVDATEEGRLALLKGVDETVLSKEFEQLPGVAAVHPLKSRYKLASRFYRKEDTIIRVKEVDIGGGALFVCGGPCAIESKEQLYACGAAAKAAGAQALRGGAFKPRTSPYEFQGLGEEGLCLLEHAGLEYGLVTVSEVMDASQIDLVARHIDILQVGSRNMQNFNLLKELGKTRKPVLLKRGFSATYQDLLMAAEYILSGGNTQVILCERGIRTFETYTRNMLDVTAVPVLKELTHLPIVLDPSHGTGLRSLVSPMARASIAAGADGVIIEMHPRPDQSVSDAAQTLSFEAFHQMMHELRVVHGALRAI